MFVERHRSSWMLVSWFTGDGFPWRPHQSGIQYTVWFVLQLPNKNNFILKCTVASCRLGVFATNEDCTPTLHKRYNHEGQAAAYLGIHRNYVAHRATLLFAVGPPVASTLVRDVVHNTQFDIESRPQGHSQKKTALARSYVSLWHASGYSSTLCHLYMHQMTQRLHGLQVRLWNTSAIFQQNHSQRPNS